MSVNVLSMKFQDLANSPFGEGAKATVIVNKYCPESPLDTQVILNVIKKPDEQYLIRKIVPGTMKDGRAEFYGAEEAAKSFGLLESTPFFDKTSIGPLNRSQTDAVLRIAEAISCRNHFDAAAKEEVESLKQVLPVHTAQSGPAHKL